jgi:hypothetical protein
MTLEELTIKKNKSYEDNPGRYSATIKYVGTGGEVKTVLDTEISEALLGYIGPAITKFAHKAALEIEANLLQSAEEAKQLPEITLER